MHQSRTFPYVRNGLIFSVVILSSINCARRTASVAVKEPATLIPAGPLISNNQCDLSKSIVTRVSPVGNVTVNSAATWRVAVPSDCGTVIAKVTGTPEFSFSLSSTYQRTYSQAAQSVIESVVLTRPSFFTAPVTIHSLPFAVEEVPTADAPPPGCNMTAAPPSVVVGSGQAVTFTIQKSGFVVSTLFNGSVVAPGKNPQILPSAAGTHKAQATVVGVGGMSASCSVTYHAQLAPAFQAVVDIVMTPENTHAVGGLPGPAGYLQFGGLADCGMARCYGNQLFFKRVEAIQPPNDGTSVIYGFHSSTPGAHVPGGTGVPAGTRTIGSVADCIHGTCYGNIVFSVSQAPYNTLPAGTSIVTDVWMSPFGRGVNSPACPSGYSPVSYVADYVAGTGVSGNLAICVATRRK